MKSNFLYGSLLKNYRQRVKLTKAELAKSLKVTWTYIHNVETNRKPPPSFAVCEKISQLLRLNNKEKWEFYLTALQERISKKTEKKFMQALDQLKDSVGASDLTFDVPGLHGIPILSWEQVEGVSQKPRFLTASFKSSGVVYSSIKNKNAFAVKITNDEMEPRVLKGEIVVIDPDASLNKDDLILVQDIESKKMMLREYKISGTTVTFRPANKKYPDIPMSPPARFKILGKAKEGFKTY